MTAAFGCNTAAYTLTSGTTANTIMFYVTDYCTKTTTDLTACVPVFLAESRRKAGLSSAVDAGDPSRNAKYSLQHVIMRFTGSHEYSAELAALAVLGGQADHFSHNFKSLNFRALLTGLQDAHPERHAHNFGADFMAVLRARQQRVDAVDDANDDDADDDDDDAHDDENGPTASPRSKRRRGPAPRTAAAAAANQVTAL